MSSKANAIIIGYDHYNTLNLVRSLSYGNIKFDTIIIKANRKSFVSKSKYIQTLYYIDSIDNLTEFLIDKYQNSYQRRKPAVITTGDNIAITLDRNYESLSKFLHLSTIYGTGNNLSYFMDKCNMCEMASEIGFDTPKSIGIDLNSIDKSVLSKLEYPVLAKAQISAKGSKNDLRICTNLDELYNCLRTTPLSTEKMIIQQYIPSDNIVLVAGCRTPNGQTVLNGTIIKSKSGHSHKNLGLCSFGHLSPVTIEKEKIARFLEHIDYVGLFSFEFIRYNGKIYFIEVNFRADGLLYFYTAAGLNIPELWVRSLHDGFIHIPKHIKNIRGMNEIQYLKNYVPRLNLKENVKDFLKTDVFSIISLKDIKPFIYKIIYHSND